MYMNKMYKTMLQLIQKENMVYGTSLQANFVNMFLALSDYRFNFAGEFRRARPFLTLNLLKIRSYYENRRRLFDLGSGVGKNLYPGGF